MFTIVKVATAAMTIGASAFYFGVARHVAADTELVEAVQKLERAHTLSFRMTITLEGKKEPVVMRQFYKTPGLVRSEIEGPNPVVTIVDNSVQQGITIVPAQEAAMLIEMPKQTVFSRKDVTNSIIDDFRRLASKRGEPVGKRLFGQTSASGFRVKENEGTYVIWVDPEKKAPIVIELDSKLGNVAMHSSFSDFEIDPKLDDAMFRLEPPAGYKVIKTDGSIKTSPEDLVARILSQYTTANGGKFPERIDDPEALGKGLGAKSENGGLNPEQIQNVTAIALFVHYCKENQNRFGYQPDGVKLGDASKIVFWYKPEGKEIYRAVFGDLHIGDVTADQLPHPVKK